MTITRALVGSNDNAAVSQTLTILNQNTTGYKALVAAVKMELGTTTVLSISDNQGNVWEKVAEISNGNMPRVAMWWCPNPTTNGGDHDFTFTADASDAQYWTGGVWGINADGQIVLDDWSQATGSSTSPNAGSVARVATAVYFAFLGEYNIYGVSNTQGWTIDAQVSTYTLMLSRIESSNGNQAATIDLDSPLQYAMIAASFREIAPGQLFQRDTFTVGSDIALNSYPSGAAEWSAIMGSGLNVIAARDRVESSGLGDVFSYFSKAGAPQGRQRVAAQVGWTDSGRAASVLVRCDGISGGNMYFLGRSSTTLWQIWRVVNGSWGGAEITNINKSTGDAGQALVSFEAETNGSQVTLRAIIDGELFTFNDTSGSRILSGAPGQGIYQSGATDIQNFLDNMVIEDLDVVLASTPPHARAYGPQGYLRTLIGM